MAWLYSLSFVRWFRNILFSFVHLFSKDHSWRIAKNCWVSWSENLFKKFKQHLHHHMLFGRVSRKMILAHPKTNSNIFSYQTRLNLQMDWLLWPDETKQWVFSSTQNGFGEYRDKKYPCVQWNILLYFWCCGPIFLLEVLNILFRHMASWILSNTNR